MFIEALFTTAKTWKQSGCPLTDNWIKKIWHIYTTEYNSAIKNNVFESVPMWYVNLEPVIQSEASQEEKNKYHILIHIYGIQKNGIEEPVCREGMETQLQRMGLRTQWGKNRVG